MRNLLHIIIIPYLLTVLCSCESIDDEPEVRVQGSISTNDSFWADSSKRSAWIEETLKTVPPNLKPLFGYRFVIAGDFDGNGDIEKLSEHFISMLDNKETNKYYDRLPNYDQLVALTIAKKPASFLVSDDIGRDTLFIASEGQLLGLSFLKNEGDLDGDGGDEISYVVNWVDWSSQNTCHVMTYKRKKWKELYSFSIMDWQIPGLYRRFDNYKLFEKKMAEFPGLIKKIEKNKILVRFINDEQAQDSAIVDLGK